MGRNVTRRYRAALELLNLTRLAEDTSRSYRTLMAYRKGDRRITHEAALELVEYLHGQSEALTAAADALQAAIEREQADGTP